eukprot:648199-Rhodomonas_salina.2
MSNRPESDKHFVLRDARRHRPALPGPGNAAAAAQQRTSASRESRSERGAPRQQQEDGKV